MSEERRGENQDLFAVTSMIPYYDSLTGEEKREVTDSIRLLLRQTFLLERKYDRRTEPVSYTHLVGPINLQCRTEVSLPAMRPMERNMNIG